MAGLRSLYLGLLVVAILAGNEQAARASLLFTDSVLIDGVASISIPGSAAPATDHFDIVGDPPGLFGPFDASGIGADVRITTSGGVSMTSYQHTLNVIANQPHTFTITINDLNNGLSGSILVPFTLSAMYAEGQATSSVPSHSYVPVTFMIGLDSFTIADASSGFYTGPDAPMSSGGTSPTSGAFVVHVTGQVGLPAVPEPSSLVLLGIGAFGLACYVWRRRNLVVA